MSRILNDKEIWSALNKLDEEGLKKVASMLGVPVIKNMTREQYIGHLMVGGCAGCGKKLSPEEKEWSGGITSDVSSFSVSKKMNTNTRKIEVKLVIK